MNTRVWHVSAQNLKGDCISIYSNSLSKALDHIDPYFSEFTRLLIHSIAITPRSWYYMVNFGVYGSEVIECVR